MQRSAVLADAETSSPSPSAPSPTSRTGARDAVVLEGEDGLQTVVLARLDDERKRREPRPERLPVHRYR